MEPKDIALPNPGNTDDVNAKAARIGVELFKQRASGKISAEEFHTKIAYWMLRDCFDNVNYIAFPAIPPEMIEYWHLDDELKKKVSADFFKQTAIAEYLKKKYEVMAQNKHNLDWMAELYGMLPESATEDRQRVGTKFSEYKAMFHKDMREHKAQNNENTVR